MPRVKRVLPLPEGDQEVVDAYEVDPNAMPEGWQLAYKRAIGKGCSDKAAKLYAEAHAHDFEPKEPAKEPTPEEIQADIERLQQKLEAAEAREAGA